MSRSNKRLRRHLSITTNGASLRLHNGALRVGVGDVSQSVPLGILDGVDLYGSQLVTTDAIALCLDNGVSVSSFSSFGRLRWMTDGGGLGNVILRREQWRTYFSESERVALARRFVQAKIMNQRRLLSRYARNHSDVCFDDAVDHLRGAVSKLESMHTIQDVMSIEGVAASCYWSAFGDMVRNDDFVFGGRSKRPSEDEINAMLSFGYVVLTNDVAGCLRSVGFDSQCGFLHECRSGRFSLACDVVEELRAPIVDRLVLRLVNNYEMLVDDFVHNGREVLLSDDGRKKFLVAWDKNRSRVVRHRGIDDDVQVGELPLIQARLLARHLRGEIDEYLAYVMDE